MVNVKGIIPGIYLVIICTYHDMYRLVYGFLVQCTMEYNAKAKLREHIKVDEEKPCTGWSIIYVTITKCNNFTYLQQLIFIYVLNCSLINEIYVKVLP